MVEKLSMVVEELWVLTRVHGEAVVEDEGFIGRRWRAV
jgi:hypothetical protein